MVPEDGSGGGARTGGDEHENDENNAEDLRFKPYSDDYIEIKYPAGWQVSKGELEGMREVIFSSIPEASGAGASTGGDETENDENNGRLSDEEYGKFFVRDLPDWRKERWMIEEAHKGDPHTVRSGETTSNGREVLFYIVQKPNRKLKEFYVFDEAGGSTYELLYSTPIDRYDESIADYMIDSFKILQ